MKKNLQEKLDQGKHTFKNLVDVVGWYLAVDVDDVGRVLAVVVDVGSRVVVAVVVS